MLLALTLGLFAALLSLAGQRWVARAKPASGGAVQLAASRLVHPVLLSLLLGLATASALAALHERSGHTWNSVRTVLPVALTHGIHIYNPPGQGALWCNIYPPLAFVLYTPTALATLPSTAIAIGQTLSLLFILLPTAFLAWRAAATHKLQSALITAAAMLGAAVLFPPLRDVTFMVHVDAPAIGLALLACAFLLSPAPSTRQLILAGVLAAASMFCKQTMLPLGLMLALATALRTRTFRPALTLLAAWLASGLLLTAATAAAFDIKAVIYCIYTVPSRQPIQFDAASRHDLLVAALLYLLPPGLLATLFAYAHRKAPFTLPLLLAGLGQLPLTTIAFLKTGGEQNNFAYVSFFWVAATLLSALHLAATAPRPGALLAARVLLLFAAATAFWNLVTIRSSPAWNTPNQHDQAYAVIHDHPGQYYFYWLPLSHLLAENRPTHQSWGIMDRALAGEQMNATWFWSYLPPNTTIAAARDTPIEFDAGYRLVHNIFPRQIHPNTLPGWYCFTTDQPQSPPPPTPRP